MRSSLILMAGLGGVLFLAGRLTARQAAGPAGTPGYRRRSSR